MMLLLLWCLPLSKPPLPTARQLDFMELETIQFMHFNVNTAWKPSADFLHGSNPTYHNCEPGVSGTSNDSQTEGVWPCLNANIFNPAKIDTDAWMEASAALGMKEVCLTAKHAGGFALWPSNHTPYGVHASMAFRGGKGDILRDFVASAKKWGIAVCYYLNPLTDGYLTQIAAVGAEEYIAREHGMLREILAPGSPYGPVNRLWFDGVLQAPPPYAFRPGYLNDNYTDYYDATFALIRELSPATLISPSRGDVCNSIGSLYTNDGPAANGTNASTCSPPSETGQFFHPNELHGVTMQEGPDGNSDAVPTYWFWHPWACAGNVSGCPWAGHANASRIFDGYVGTVGHGGVMNMNIAPQADGTLNASVVAVMHEAGKAINDTFHLNDAGMVRDTSAPCGAGVAVVNVTGPFDFIVTMEDLTRGQRIGNYSIDFRREGSAEWEVLVPPVQPPKPPKPHDDDAPPSPAPLGDRPDGNDPRDQYIGHKRIDVPVVPTSGAGAVAVAQVRFNCIRLVASVDDPADSNVHLRRFSLHKKVVPWGQSK